MSEVADIFKIIVDKVGFKTVLFSLIVAILFYKLYLSDWLWGIVVFGICYFLVCIISYTSKRINRYIASANEKLKIKQERQNHYYRMSLIYNSLPDYMQKALILLYQLPCQTYYNVRVLNNFPSQITIYSVCMRIEEEYQLITVRKNFQSYIIEIDEIFCDVLNDSIHAQSTTK